VYGQLRYLITGGDVVEPSIIRRVLQHGAPENLLNAYGPTECTTFSTIFRTNDWTEDGRSLPIGRPIANARILILDARLRPVPIGVVGEIYIGGAGVALGYLNRPEMTSERFVTDPFSTTGARLYKSGDLARWRPDGTVEFVGRGDQQVKVRGFRIELGEIEACLARHPGVREAIVTAGQDAPGDNKRLVAYYTCEAGQDPPVEDLRSHLKASLPEYMVPGAFVLMPSLPLTVNGKPDRRGLPPPGLNAYASKEFEAPIGEVEDALAQIWSSLLRVERIGRHDNFFELGGHSLQATRLVANIVEQLGVELSVVSIFRGPTIEQLAESVAEARAEFEQGVI
jgi:acyl-CoA synthetase (AMP-forming)/AMP-acid ligase II/acyl carrier protein